MTAGYGLERRIFKVLEEEINSWHNNYVTGDLFECHHRPAITYLESAVLYSR